MDAEDDELAILQALHAHARASGEDPGLVEELIALVRGFGSLDAAAEASDRAERCTDSQARELSATIDLWRSLPDNDPSRRR
ncbi:hypothetical protein QMK19_11760 [Streptomyces sp. H10-C2]|uniref:hypothetical protein n=1 Tax=unclassified Streptomyces TaxID=2593676 RepID=UPI0024BB5091|nr:MULTISPECIES: hypothetical protein [unclassified Streptomyces]MDJ0347193.1 hypothetical protein [Streptomyces sp. PH10-H1]MDJ0370334.1 hypothetical protein [Streptomyces sp. H10-C2]